MTTRISLALGTALLLLASGSPAHAQDVLIQGPGIKLSESAMLQPRLGVEAGVVSNVFFEDTGPDSAGVVRLIAGFDLAPAAHRLGNDEVGAPRLDYKLGAELRYNEYLSSSARVRAQRNLDANVHGGVTFNPEGTVAFELADQFARQARPTNFESSEQLTRDRNHFFAEGRYQPGGRMLKFGLRYENVIDLFEADSVSFADRLQHTIGLKGTWKFFPYSQVWLDASLGFFGPLGGSEVGGMAYKVSSNPLRILAGLDTVLTEPTTLKLYAGYANGFYSEGPSYSAPVAGIDFGWRYMPVGRVTVGYAYEAEDSINANYYQEHRLHAGVAQQLRRIYATVGSGIRFRGYRGISPAIAATPNRDDLIIELSARADYILRERFSFYAAGLLQSVQTEFRDLSGDDPSFVRGEVVIGASAAF